jgi:hypothetical protein
VAIDTTLRFVRVLDLVDPSWVGKRLKLNPPARQRVVRVTEPVVAKTMGFRFAQPWTGLEVIPKAGTPVANDGDTVWRTPYDECVLVMPSMRHLKPGTTMVRLGRYS